MTENLSDIWQSVIESLYHSNDKTRLRIVRGTDIDIEHMDVLDGALYFAYNTGKIYLDKAITLEDGTTEVRRFQMSSVSSGAGSAGYLYANASLNLSTLEKVNPDLPPIDDPQYYIYRSAFEGDLQSLPDIDTLIINSDGQFFRVREKQGLEDRVIADLIASAGGGGGSGGGTVADDLSLAPGNGWNNGRTFIYGQSLSLTLIPHADRSNNVEMSIYIYDNQHSSVVLNKVYTQASDETFVFDTSILPESTNLSIRISLGTTPEGEGLNPTSRMYNAQKPTYTYSQIKVVEMGVAKDISSVTSAYYTGISSLTFTVIGDSNEVVVTPHLFIDGDEISSSDHRLAPFLLSSSKKTLTLPRQVHGVHTVEIYLTTVLDGVQLRTDSINYELAWIDNSSDVPLIWFESLPETVINYDNVIIKYQVYNPTTEANHTTATVNLLQERTPIPNSPIAVSYNQNQWLEWDISSLYKINGIADTVNNFSIACGAVRRDFSFIVTSKGARELGLVNENSLALNLSSAGRSNNEDVSVRNSWSYTNLNIDPPETYSTNFINFNWFNNGWKDDNNGLGAYLSVANGASATIGFKPIELNGSSSTTIEMRFRVRNIQEYSTLVTTIARYNVEEDPNNAYTVDEIERGYYSKYTGTLISTGSYYKQTQSGSTINYIKLTQADFIDPNTGNPIEADGEGKFTLIGTSEAIYLYQNFKYTMKYDVDGNPEMNEAKSTKEVISDKGVCFKYFDGAGYGFCIGTQEAFFKSRSGVANVRYKEDEVINITFAIAGGENAHNLYIYLNGILSGAINLGVNGSDIESINTNMFQINSKYCDFDLYKLRIYNTYLTMPEVIHNYISDTRSTDLYDQNQLTDARDGTSLLYSKVIQYNQSIIEENSAVTGRTAVNNYLSKLTMPYAVIQTIDNIAMLNLARPEDLGSVSPDDDRLPYIKEGGNRYVKITFINPALDEALDKNIITEDFYYTHSPSYEAVGVDINVQGTSSQAYPRRNYKTKFKPATKSAPSGYAGGDEYPWGWRYLKGSKAGGKCKKWNMDNTDCATTKFTWKIDYMESSGSYNTGFANLVGNNMYSKHPLEYYNFGDEVDAHNYRTSVYGFPVMVFHKHSQESDLEKYGTKNEADVYTYIGRYNLNLDKSANEFYGFEIEKEHPFVNKEWSEEVEEDGETITVEHHHPYISEVAECWELRDNQGTWTSFKYPGSEAREDGFGTLQDGSEQLEVIKHFEVRYNADGDPIEFCYKLDNANEAGANAVETSDGVIDLSSASNMRDYLRRKHHNLEILFDWLDSTDTSVVPATDTGVPLSAAEQARKFDDSIKYMVETVENNGVKETWFVNSEGTHIYKMPTEKDSEGNIILHKDAAGYLLDDNDQPLTQCIAPTNYTGTVRSFNIKVSYNTDCAGYRLHKFKEEFSKHLNLEYCIIYFILTELLLCYDSRGKNMMIATWGPQEVGGDYIWFPIFYDIDTQLGLNNIGAVLWDYNADATLDGDFSTANSVLWVNLWAAFRTTIESTYRTLRSGKLTETNIEGAYLCDPAVFTNSYAMKGVRPIIALGLDEYYKYILPGLNTGIQYQEEPWKAVRYGGFITTEGKWSTNAGYLYTCQGDRKLSRELLIRNRLNYLDSWWLAGNYIAAAVKDGIMIRANANDLNTSDTFLDQTMVQENVTGYEKTAYPLKYFDATPQFKITPFLSQYVTVFYDEDPIVPSQKYNGIDPVITNTTPSVENGYRAIHPYNEQLTYIPGGDFISSLGDLSLKYPSHFTLGTGKRLLDVTLGSDIPGYRNNLLGQGEGTFNLNAGASSANKKGLLQKIILTGVSGLNSSIDIVTAEKLKEFRALGTGITGVTFASGAPLDIVHLPATVQGLSLTEAKNLKNIITAQPVVMNKISGNELDHTATYEYKDRNDYLGLYIQNLTDYNPSDTSVLKFTKLNIIADSLGYDSYKIMDNMIKWRIKDAAASSDRDKPLDLTITGVDWCPYTLIESSTIPEDNALYYKATDHGTFEEYYYNPSKYNEFMRLRRNEKLFTLDPAKDAKKDFITSLEYLDLFIADHTRNNATYNGIECRYRADNSTKYEIPNIQGIMFVNNDENHPILETDLDKETGKYPTKFPNLTIYAKYITPSYIAKFIQEDDVGREAEFWLKRISTDSANLVAPYPSTIPLKQNYDFLGWSLSAENYDSNNNPILENLVISYDYDTETLTPVYDYASRCTFSNENNIITFYAVFGLHKYAMRFFNTIYDSEPLITVRQTFSTIPGINEPNIVPSLTTSNLDLTETYKWLGWAQMNNPDVTVDLNTITPIFDIDFVARYQKVSVYDNVMSQADIDKYLIYGKVQSSDPGYAIGLNPNYQLTGKITLPTTINGVPVTRIGYSQASFQGDYGQNHKITHIFWDLNNRALQYIGAACFQNSTDLVYYEQPSTCRIISEAAFNGCSKLGTEDSGVCLTEILRPITQITGGYIFQGIGYQQEHKPDLVLPGHSYDILANYAFGGMSYTPHVFIGSDAAGAEDPCMWENMVNGTSPIITTNSDLFTDLNSGLGPPDITIYTSNGSALSFDVRDYFGIESASSSSVSYSSAYNS